MKGIESEIIRIIFQSGYYNFFEIVFIISIAAFFALLFRLVWKEFLLFLSLLKLLIFAYSEELPTLTPTQRSGVGLEEVA